MEYKIERALAPPNLNAEWDSADWENANIAELNNFRIESKSRHPKVRVKLLYDDTGIYGLFQVDDQYVRSVTTEYQGSVCTDSCVEFFVQPGGRGGYLNFEINCGGTLLVSFITDHKRTPNGFKEFKPLPPEDGAKVRIFHSMPSVVEPEIQEPVTWRNAFFIPAELFEKYGGVKTPFAGQVWRGNFYKCADQSSHNHWASWNPVSKLNFHLPECFASLIFE